jgi:hypothetical protein
MTTSSSVQAGEAIHVKPIQAMAPLNISATIAGYELAVGKYAWNCLMKEIIRKSANDERTFLITFGECHYIKLIESKIIVNVLRKF